MDQGLITGQRVAWLYNVQSHIAWLYSLHFTPGCILYTVHLVVQAMYSVNSHSPISPAESCSTDDDVIQCHMFGATASVLH